MRTFTALLLCLLFAIPASAGTTYRVTANPNGRVTTYEVSFGGGRMFEQYTAYDPESGQFVYLRFNRGEPAPEPAARIWDHQTGRTIELYTFPGVDHPLPRIPSIEAMTACPKTGAEEFTYQPIIAYD